MPEEASGRSRGDIIGLVTFDVDREWDGDGCSSEGGGEGALAGTDAGGEDETMGGGVGVVVGGVAGSGSAIV
jgi:hypothetical protein